MGRAAAAVFPLHRSFPRSYPESTLGKDTASAPSGSPQHAAQRGALHFMTEEVKMRTTAR